MLLIGLHFAQGQAFALLGNEMPVHSLVAVKREDRFGPLIFIERGQETVGGFLQEGATSAGGVRVAGDRMRVGVMDEGPGAHQRAHGSDQTAPVHRLCPAGWKKDLDVMTASTLCSGNDYAAPIIFNPAKSGLGNLIVTFLTVIVSNSCHDSRYS